MRLLVWDEKVSSVRSVSHSQNPSLETSLILWYSGVEHELNMKINFLFVCDSVTNDKKLNVEGIFDSVASQGFPALHPVMFVVVNLEIPQEEQGKSYVESFKILFDNKIIIEDTTSFSANSARHQFLHRIENLGLENPGRYDIQIFMGGKKIGETYFMAKQI